MTIEKMPGSKHAHDVFDQGVWIARVFWLGPNLMTIGSTLTEEQKQSVIALFDKRE
jgi:hypothetical protein